MGVYINHMQHIEWTCLYLASEPLTYAGVRAVHFAAGIGLVAWGTSITLGPYCVVHAALTHSSAPPPTGFVHSRIEMTLTGVAVALATWGTKHCELFQITFNIWPLALLPPFAPILCMLGWGLTLAGVGFALLCRPPGQVIEEIITAFTVHACGVVLTVTPRGHLCTSRPKKSIRKYPEKVSQDL